MKLPRFSVSLLLASALAVLGCGAPAWQNAPHDKPFQHTPPPQLHEAPRELEYSDWWEAFYNGSFEQWGRLISPGYHLEKAVDARPALDVNDFGKVPDSAWFENRMGKSELDWQAVYGGPNGAGPAPGPLTITSAKTVGVTPGLLLKDSAGVDWVVKFDPPAYPEMASAAEVIATRLMWAAGYHVPENFIYRFYLDRLQLSEKATSKDDYGRKVRFGKTALADLMALLNPEPDGQIRALFSKRLPGKPLGPFPLRGTRLDDPNDRIPHERRRSLRGLWVFYAWLNNTDAKVTNSFDTFVEVDDKRKLGYVKHYLLDFGSALGSAATGPKPLEEGYDYIVDWERVFTRLFAGGVYYPYWVVNKRTPLRSVGQFEYSVFDPAKWRPMYPNTPFDRADDADTFWAASILAHFDLVTIAAAVAAGEYSEPEARAWVTYALVQRRDRILRYAFSKHVPLDAPRVDDRGHFQMTDLEVLAGLRRAAAVRYRFSVDWHGPDAPRRVSASRTRRPSVWLNPIAEQLQRSYGPERLAAHPFFTLTWTREADGRPAPRERLIVRMRRLPSGGWLPIGIER